MIRIEKPFTGEYKPYAATYINQLPDDGAVLQHLAANMQTISDLIRAQSPEKLLYRYDAGKWTLKEIMIHIIDTERVFAYRAMCIARNDKTSFPGFEQDDYVAASNANDREIESILKEYEATRHATLAMLQSFSEADVLKLGTANGSPVSVRALIYQIAGHELHHLNIIRERYINA